MIDYLRKVSSDLTKQKDNPALDPVFQDLGKLVRFFMDWPQADLFKNATSKMLVPLVFQFS